MGNTVVNHPLSPVFLDHPHLRGEYEIMTQVDKGAKGPPPLAWGILITAIEHRPNMGITPTCVGNTVDASGTSLLQLGSPPLAWGILNF